MTRASNITVEIVIYDSAYGGCMYMCICAAAVFVDELHISIGGNSAKIWRYTPSVGACRA